MVKKFIVALLVVVLAMYQTAYAGTLAMESRGPGTPLLESRGPGTPLLESRGPGTPLLESRGPGTPLLESRGPGTPLLQSDNGCPCDRLIRVLQFMMNADPQRYGPLAAMLRNYSG